MADSRGYSTCSFRSSSFYFTSFQSTSFFCLYHFFLHILPVPPFLPPHSLIFPFFPVSSLLPPVFFPLAVTPYLSGRPLIVFYPDLPPFVLVLLCPMYDRLLIVSFSRSRCSFCFPPTSSSGHPFHSAAHHSISPLPLVLSPLVLFPPRLVV